MSKVYVLRCCDSKRQGYGGFQWPDSGEVVAPDWSPEPECGMGLHGWLNGEGDVSASSHHADDDAVWLVCEVESADIVQLGGKIKFPRCNVIFCGSRTDAVARMVELCPGAAVHYGTATAGKGGTATAGEGGTATAGNYGTATAGEGGIIAIKHWNGKRWRLEVAHVGEDGIEADVPYRLDDGGAFIRADGAKP